MFVQFYYGTQDLSIHEGNNFKDFLYQSNNGILPIKTRSIPLKISYYLLFALLLITFLVSLFFFK